MSILEPEDPDTCPLCGLTWSDCSCDPSEEDEDVPAGGTRRLFPIESC